MLGVPTEVAGPCAEAPAYKFLELRVLSLFVFLDTRRGPDRSYEDIPNEDLYP